MVSTAGDDTEAMGFNPHRKYRATRTDYVVVVLALLTVVALLAWTVLG
jgi:hypothetical protein